MEWKLRPGCTLKQARLFHTGSSVAVGTTAGSCGVSAQPWRGARMMGHGSSKAVQ
jgi:hypothetical protein